MHNFTYYNPVKIIFGKQSINELNQNICQKNIIKI